jgi:uncharacterized protein (UPF0548 family)
VTATPYSYPEVGATAGALPPGYRLVRREAVVGTGRTVFDAVAERTLTWQVHRGAGLVVDADQERVDEGGLVRLGLRLGPVRLVAPCRVVYVVDEPTRRGFAYGTLPGHPESGESLFEAELGDDDRVTFRVVSFSTPATWWSRLGAPVTRRVQDVVTDRYVRAAGG